MVNRLTEREIHYLVFVILSVCGILYIQHYHVTRLCLEFTVYWVHYKWYFVMKQHAA